MFSGIINQEEEKFYVNLREINKERKHIRLKCECK